MASLIGTARARRQLAAASSLLGIDPRRIVALRHVPRFLRDVWRYRRRARSSRFPLRLSRVQPVLSDLDEQAGVARGHYLHQDLWAARKIHERRPASHVDVGSRIDGFVAHLLTFMPVMVIDVRPLESRLDGLTFMQGSAQNLSAIGTDSIESLSSLHAVEHFGLGRYGDPIDPEACFAAMRELARILKPDGRLYFSVPIGAERVEFNAHRIFAPGTVIDAFSALDLVSFSGVDDAGDLCLDRDPYSFAGADYACGLFEFSKRVASSSARPHYSARHRNR